MPGQTSVKDHADSGYVTVTISLTVGGNVSTVKQLNTKQYFKINCNTCTCVCALCVTAYWPIHINILITCYDRQILKENQSLYVVSAVHNEFVFIRA